MNFAFTSARMSHHSTQEEGGETHEREQGQKEEHVSVMVGEVLQALLVKKGDVVVDATYGRGGHSKALLSAADITLVAIDADPSAPALGKKGPQVVEANFGDLAKVLAHEGIEKVDKVLFDLGWNRTQLVSGRGFSFMHDEPLSMSYSASPRSGFTAAEALNEWSEKTLADVFFGYGEERYARRIAKAIIERRVTKPFATTLELVEVITDAVPALYRRGRISPATKTFQALRIAVNDELGALQSGLQAGWESLSCGGRIAVISFHSIEDRIVKQYFAKLVKEDVGVLMSKKPIVASAQEVQVNPPSRSAKLRVIEKVCTQ